MLSHMVPHQNFQSLYWFIVIEEIPVGVDMAGCPNINALVSVVLHVEGTRDHSNDRHWRVLFLLDMILLRTGTTISGVVAMLPIVIARTMVLPVTTTTSGWSWGCMYICCCGCCLCCGLFSPLFLPRLLKLADFINRASEAFTLMRLDDRLVADCLVLMRYHPPTIYCESSPPLPGSSCCHKQRCSRR